MPSEQRIDSPTIAGWGMLLMPLLTMWHEIGGHAATCVLQGGHVRTIGAFYVQCDAPSPRAAILVACAGVAVNIALSIVAFALWRGAQRDRARLAWWLVWVSEAFVAAGYLCFSGVTGVGDLGTGPHGALAALPYPLGLRLTEIAVGVSAYTLVVRAAIRTLSAMLGTGAVTRPARQRIAHVYYAAAGLGAVIVGLLNPVGWFITIMSAAASSFGGLAGFISIGFAARGVDAPRAFAIDRDWRVIVAGGAVLLTFALVLGRSLHF
ncbi:hypothetical protein GGQ80_003530 [Sphingomonas jinjuensis]|uniref:Uncharacterized protein n=1 Tax=Sphingomonas jinjuensis TaxID=535907 RepID=A0A840FQR9_9SPHN|nr:hypothetical protein [Sphingomonas jinjuensis]MBB4155605.1 hypothetical protein [Sphingomonas jinjuensis]